MDDSVKDDAGLQAAAEATSEARPEAPAGEALGAQRRETNDGQRREALETPGAPARTLVMGILNVTPDSFSDGGMHATPEAAIEAGLRMLEQGADIIDIGGESTRPGAEPLTAEEEWGRIGDVVAALAEAGATLSIDTYHAETARRAAEAGARIINDVTGGAADPDMFAAVAAAGSMYVLQHSRGRAEEEQSYTHMGEDVAAELALRQSQALAAGIERERIILDPGFGFAKDADQCWRLAAELGPVEDLGQPLLIGVSRKRFLAEVSVGESALDRDVASAVLAFHFATRGVWAVRAHDVAATRAAVETAARLRLAGADFAALRTPESPVANAYQQAERLGRKARGGRFSLKDLFSAGPGMNSGALWG